MTSPDPTAGTSRSEAGRPTGILFVCLGNICRSPAAEGVFLHLIARQGLEQAFTVDSAGTGDWHVGRPADARMRSAAARRGIVLPSRARQITTDDLSRFDHVLTMDRQNLEAVQGLAGRGSPPPASARSPATAAATASRRCPIPTTAAKRASIGCSTCWRTPVAACWRP